MGSVAGLCAEALLHCASSGHDIGRVTASWWPQSRRCENYTHFRLPLPFILLSSRPNFFFAYCFTSRRREGWRRLDFACRSQGGGEELLCKASIAQLVLGKKGPEKAITKRQQILPDIIGHGGVGTGLHVPNFWAAAIRSCFLQSTIFWSWVFGSWSWVFLGLFM